MATPKKPGARRGRPSGYLPAYARQAYKLCLLGATDAQIVDFFGIGDETLRRWKQRVPEFRGAITRGKLIADATVAESLFKRANGYSHKAVKIFCTKEGDIVKEPYVEHYPPDTPAASLWLRNRQPDKWRNIVDHQHHNPNRTIDDLSTDELLRIYEGGGGGSAGEAPAAEEEPHSVH